MPQIDIEIDLAESVFQAIERIRNTFSGDNMVQHLVNYLQANEEDICDCIAFDEEDDNTSGLRDKHFTLCDDCPYIGSVDFPCDECRQTNHI